VTARVDLSFAAAPDGLDPVVTDDRPLVARTLAGDRQAFALIMRRHNRRLYRLARATLRDDAEAEDALQDAYVDAFRSLAQFRHDAALATWLSRLVLNQCFARRRRAMRRQNVIPIQNAGLASDLENVADPACGPEGDAMRDQTRTMLERELDALPDEYRLAFVLREVEEMSVAEAAASLDVPEATVRSRAFRARALLRERLACDLDVAARDVYEFGGARCDRIVASVLRRIEAALASKPRGA
jgi:RNA polymerase sigma-70 factor (ECF subfamily)